MKFPLFFSLFSYFLIKNNTVASDVSHAFSYSALYQLPAPYLWVK